MAKNTDENLEEEVTSTATRSPLVDRLLKKKPREKTVKVSLDTDSGEMEEVELLFRAIGATEYDRLIEQCPPTKQDQKDGMAYNIDKFAPMLIAAVSQDPLLTVDDAKAIWESDHWNRGERMALFQGAVEVCTSGINLPFSNNE